MRNIPAFTCGYGVATLILQEIPTRGEAYCVVQWANPGQTGPLLQACSQFCRMAGAQRVLSSQAPGPAGTPPQIQLLRMTRSRAGLPETDAALRPLLPELAEDFLRIYRKGMSRVPAVLTLRDTDIPQILARGGAYFVHRDETLLGIGQVEKDTLLSVVSCRPGAGWDVTAALLSVTQGDTVRLQVARDNHRAIALYQKLGFAVVGTGACWWEI